MPVTIHKDNIHGLHTQSDANSSRKYVLNLGMLILNTLLAI